MKLHEEARAEAWAQGWGLQEEAAWNAVRIAKSHRDQVLKLPEGARTLASSPHVPVEMFALGDHVLCIQGHPEMNEGIVETIVSERMESGIVPQAVGKEALESLEGAPLHEHRELLRLALKRFLKGGINE